MTEARLRQLRRLPAARLAGPAMWAAAKLRVARWDALMKSPRRLREVQEQMLLRLLGAARHTRFGRAHDLGRIRSQDEFARRVPTRTYADFEPSFERMREGERDVLYPGFVYYWGQSSGTSHTAAKHKFLPISREQIRWQQLAGFDVLARYLTLWGELEFPGGYMLGLFPPSTIQKVGPVGVASNPGIMQLHVPYPAKLLQLPKVPVRDIPTYQAKLEAMAEAYLDYDVWSLTGTTCWFSVFFDHVLAAAGRRGMRVRHIQDIWPNLRVLLGGGVPAEPYRSLIEGRMGRPIAILENYSATEGGFFATTDSRADAAMLMIPDRGVFFEFVPRSAGDSDAKRVPLWEVEPGIDYSVVLTTSSGLFGYAIGDYIRFESTFPHRMRFIGRPAGVLSLTQELTTALEIERAVSHATKVAQCTTVDFAASSEVGVEGTGKGRYVLFVEFEAPPADVAAFAAAFDDELRAQNRVYGEHRANDVAILAPLVRPLSRGATKRFMRDLGQYSFQQKFPRILTPEQSRLLRAHLRV
ncbi:MAG TPA: hypothetical protein ENK57_20945 [Polyangiaceae bacterium]|nr:hypothetical protein [Polyangiaceae bacterium]